MGSKLGQMIVEVLLWLFVVLQQFFSLQPKMEKIIKPLEGNWVGTIV